MLRHVRCLTSYRTFNQARWADVDVQARVARWGKESSKATSTRQRVGSEAGRCRNMFSRDRPVVMVSG